MIHLVLISFLQFYKTLTLPTVFHCCFTVVQKWNWPEGCGFSFLFAYSSMYSNSMTNALHLPSLKILMVIHSALKGSLPFFARLHPNKSLWSNVSPMENLIVVPCGRAIQLVYTLEKQLSLHHQMRKGFTLEASSIYVISKDSN